MRRLLMVIAFLAFTGAARADWVAAPTPASVASAHWPDSPCHGREIVHLVRQQTIDAFVPLDPPGAHTGYQPGPGSCDVYIEQSIASRPITYCSLLIHEFGHAAGLAHSSDSTNVMYGPMIVIAPECLQFATLDIQRAIPQRRLRKALRHSAGSRRSGW